MTKAQADKILAAPKFGDQNCIAARQRLTEEPLTQKLRAFLVGRSVQCGACGGTGDRCKLCRADGSIEITRELADSWELDILEEVLEENIGEEMAREFMHERFD